MPVYSYNYLQNGRIHQGTGQAKSEQALRSEFMQKGIELTGVSIISSSEDSQKIKGRAGTVTLAIFCRQFSAMVDAGVSLIKCLEVLSRQTQDRILQLILLDIGKRIQQGESLSHSLAYHPKTFNNLFVGLVRAGEVGGVLDITLARLASFLEKEVELKRKIKSALTYPMLVLIASIGIVIFLVSWVVPQFAELFEGIGLSNQEFPGPTQLLINLSHLFSEGWVKLVTWIVFLFVVFRTVITRPWGKRLFDIFKLKMPVFGSLHHKVCMVRFSRTLGTLLGSGVPILQAMETVSGTVGNVVIAEAILASREKIHQGASIAKPLEESGWFPPMVVHMVSVGEESGSLDAMLSKVADFYDTEVDGSLASLTASLEPVMIVTLGVIVGFIVIAMFMPAVQVMEQIQSGQLE